MRIEICFDNTAETVEDIVDVDKDLTAEDIMYPGDYNEQFLSARIKAEMITIKGNSKIVKGMILYSQKGDVLTELTYTRDRGTKYSKLEVNFSYQDDLVSERLTELYQFELLGMEEIHGRMAYVLRGTAREEEEVSYYERKIWIDQERNIWLREELYARNSRMLKVAEVTQVDLFDDDRWYPTEMVMSDQLMTDSSIIFRVKEIEFNPEITEGTFSLVSLK